MSNKSILYNLVVIFIIFNFTSEIKKDSTLDYLKSLLQKKVPNSLLLSAIQFIRKLTPHDYPGNYENNIQKFEKHKERIKRNKGYIEDQYNYWDLKYGSKTIEFSGCEIIAAYNALYDLTGEENRNFPEMIDYFEKDGILLYGTLGTAPQAVEEYINKLGFETIHSTNKEEYLQIQNSCDAFLLTKYNNIEDITQAIHTISISKKDGKFYTHNNGSIGIRTKYNSILDLINKIDGGRAKDIVLIGIKKKINK